MCKNTVTNIKDPTYRRATLGAVFYELRFEVNVKEYVRGRGERTGGEGERERERRERERKRTEIKWYFQGLRNWFLRRRLCQH